MRVSLLKVIGLSIAALVLGGALAATPAFAKGGFGGPGGSYHSGGAPSFTGAPSFGGPISHGNSFPSGGFTPQGNAVPHYGVPQPGGAQRHPGYANGWRYRRGPGGVWAGPYLCDDYDYDCYNGYYDYGYYGNGYDNDDSACWVYRRVYNKHGKFLGWRQVFVCQNGQ